MSRTPLLFIILFLLSCSQSPTYTTWSIYRGDEGSNAYSKLKQINISNVSQLKVAWTYRTGDEAEYISLECSPIIVGKVLYGISPRLKTFALDAKTGKQIWSFNPFDKGTTEGGVSRGLTYWEDKNEKRIFIFVYNKLIALDASTGKQIMNFGDSGYVDLNKDLRDDGKERKEDVQNTSPCIIYKDILITGSAVGERYESSPIYHDAAFDSARSIFPLQHPMPKPSSRKDFFLFFRLHESRLMRSPWRRI